MKKSIVVFAFALAGATFGAANDALVSFSTKGPDKYADGTTVLDGECYALVWAPKDSTGVVFAADGTVQGGEVVLAAPLAAGGRCPSVLFEVDAADMSSKYVGGTWGVYLLDTRRWGAGSAAKPVGLVGGRLQLVNAAGRVSDARVGAGSSGVASGAEATASTATVVPDGTPKPQIVGVKIEGAYVYVTVKGTVPYLQYDLASGEAPDALTGRADAPCGGAESVDEEVVFVAPAKEKAGFFRVGRKE